MIRHALVSDIPRIVELAKAEHAMSQWAGRPFHAASAAAAADSFIRMPGRTMLFSGGGYLAGLLQPLGFSPELAAIEYAWYAEDGSGWGLLCEFKEWAARCGATELMVHSHGHNERLERLLTLRGGFSPAGRVMTQKLEA